MIESRLFSVLPEYICTPDGFAVDKNGGLVLSCPNYAEDTASGCVVRVGKDGSVEKWFDVPVHPETGAARNMGIAFDDAWNIYLCDNQGWSERPDLIYKGRILKLTVDDEGNILKTVVCFEMALQRDWRSRKQRSVPIYQCPGTQLNGFLRIFTVMPHGIQMDAFRDSVVIQMCGSEQHRMTKHRYRFKAVFFCICSKSHKPTSHPWRDRTCSDRTQHIHLLCPS